MANPFDQFDKPINPFDQFEGTQPQADNANVRPRKNVYDISPAEAFMMGGEQGLTFGFGDEIKSAIGAGVAYPFTRDTELSYGDLYEMAMERQQAELAAAREQQAGAMLGGEVAGAIGTGLAGGAKLAGTKVLQGAGLPTAAGLGALSGGVYGYGTGYGGVEERLAEVPAAAAMGGLGGAAGGAISRGIGRAVKGAKSALGRGAQEVAPAADEMIGLGGVPLSQTDDIAAAQGRQITMPKGAATDDVNLMRLEEAARQGQFGDDLQRQMATLDARTKADVLNRLQSLAGKTTEESDELLSKGIQKVQGRYKAAKAMQGKLMNARNDAIARTSVYKDYVQNTLGNQIDDLAKTPDFEVALMRPDNAPIKDDIKILRSLLKDKKVSGINFKFLQSWRAGLNDYYGKGQQGALASQLSKTYDDWLDNVALTDAIKAGDEDVANKIFKANKEYSKFKSLYGTDKFTGQNSVIQDILTKEAITPVQAVNTLFGKSVAGNNTTAQNLRRLIKGAGNKADAVKQDFRAGLVMRAYEDATKKGDLSLSALKNNLIKMRRSEAYKMNLATPEYDAVIDGLVSDLGKVVTAQSRRDVYAPSAPAVIRYLSKIFDGAGYILPSSRAVSTGLETVGKAASSRPAQKKVEKAIRQVMEEAQEVMAENTAVYGAIPGGVSGSAVMEQ